MLNKDKLLQQAQEILNSVPEGGNLSNEQQVEFDSLMIQAGKTNPDGTPWRPGRQVKPDSVIMDDPAAGPMHDSAAAIPARARTPLAKNQVRIFENDKDAFQFAKFVGSVVGHPGSMAYCRENGLQINALQSEGVDTGGGFLVPDQFTPQIINLRNSYGVFRRFAFPQEMKTEVCKTPRVTSHGDVYYVGEGSQITPSAIAIDQINLVARKPAMIFTFSRELNDDSAVSLGNLLGDEIAWSLAYAEDMAGFIGDGTSTYGGINGIVNKLSDLNGVDDGGGLQLATGDTMAEHTVIDFANMIAKCPAYAKRPGRARFYCSSAFYAATMLRLLVSAGGNFVQSLATGQAGNPIFMGYEVVFSECLPTSDAASQINCLFGDMSLSSTLGDRMAITIEESNSATVDGSSLFERDLYAIRGLERYDINNHDLGTATVAGPVVGLISASE